MLKGAVSLFFRLLFGVVGLAVFAPAASADPPDVTQFIETAGAMRLHEDRYWHVLLHYRKSLFGIESQVDDPAFFLAPDGKTNPKAELETTIRALFGPPAEADDPLCRFYARYHWLKDVLDPENKLPGRTCPEIDRIVPRSASLIFPTYYMNNPASMFGHTLLIVDTAYTSKRLSNAVNFAAFTRGNNGLILVLSGLFGLYKGYFSVMPYYKKIQEYGDIDQRDIWEYRLNLTPEELRRMVHHIRELDKIYTDYYFFDENCSYSLLYLIEAARPSVHLTDAFRLWVLPVDTIGAIKQAGLIDEVTFRPATATRIRHQVGTIDPESMKTVTGIVEGAIRPETVTDSAVSDDTKTAVLDLATEVIQYRYVKRTIDRDAYREQLLAALKARSRLGPAAEADDLKGMAIPPRPDEGHDSSRISLGTGSDDGEFFIGLRWRPAFTDLTDTDYISRQGAQIEFADLRCRYHPRPGRFTLEQFDILDIVSISPADAFFRPFSWKINTGLHRKPMENGKDGLYYRAGGGGGFAAHLPYAGLCYAMAEARLNAGGALAQNYALGPGGGIGTVMTLSPDWKAHLYGQAVRFVSGDSHADYQAGLTQTLKVSRNHHLSLETAWQKAHARSRPQAELLWHFFF